MCNRIVGCFVVSVDINIRDKYQLEIGEHMDYIAPVAWRELEGTRCCILESIIKLGQRSQNIIWSKIFQHQQNRNEIKPTETHTKLNV